MRAALDRSPLPRLNEAAYGGGRYAWARSNVFPSQPGSGNISPVMIAKRSLQISVLFSRENPFESMR